MSRTEVCDAVLFELALVVGNAEPSETVKRKRLDQSIDGETDPELDRRAAREAKSDAQPGLKSVLDEARNNDCLPEQIPGESRLSIEEKLKDSILNDVRRDAGIVNRSDTVMDILEGYLD